MQIEKMKKNPPSSKDKGNFIVTPDKHSYLKKFEALLRHYSNFMSIYSQGATIYKNQITLRTN